MSAPKYPFNKGQLVRLALNHWYDGVKEGSAATVLKQRKDRRCKSGFQVVAHHHETERTLKLDAAWFKS